MEFISPELLAYCEAHTQAEDPLLLKITRETQAKVLLPRMLSGHLQGKTLEFFAKMMQPSAILEIGTFTGYSAICLARGLAPGGKLLTLDINDELETMVRVFFEESGLASQIDYRLGNARELLPDISGPFDLIFIDADKYYYSTYYELVIDKLRPGGILMADNVLWSGKILVQEGQKIDKDTQALLDFNRQLAQDPRIETLLLPIRDGILLARKK